MGNPWRCTGLLGIKPLIALKSLKFIGDQGNNSDEDDIDVDNSYSKDEESNDEFDDAQI